MATLFKERLANNKRCGRVFSCRHVISLSLSLSPDIPISRRRLEGKEEDDDDDVNKNQSNRIGLTVKLIDINI